MSDVVLNKVSSAVADISRQTAGSRPQTQIDKTTKIESSNSLQSTATKSLTASEIKNTINKINENVGILNKDVKFVYNDTIKSLVVQVVNAKTGKMIREIPPKEVINLQKKLSEVVGIIFDSKEVK